MQGDWRVESLFVDPWIGSAAEILAVDCVQKLVDLEIQSLIT